jgi:hypothetical protein
MRLKDLLSDADADRRFLQKLVDRIGIAPLLLIKLLDHEPLGVFHLLGIIHVEDVRRPELARLQNALNARGRSVVPQHPSGLRVRRLPRVFQSLNKIRELFFSFGKVSYLHRISNLS